MQSLTDNVFTKALRRQLAFENSPQLNAAYLGAHLRYTFSRYPCWRYTQNIPTISQGFASLPRKKKCSFGMSRIQLLEGNEFSAFQTNAAATFRAGSLGIPPYSILDYNDMLGRLSNITTQKTATKTGSGTTTSTCTIAKNGIHLWCGVTLRGAHTLRSTADHPQAWTRTQMHKKTHTYTNLRNQSNIRTKPFWSSHQMSSLLNVHSRLIVRNLCWHLKPPHCSKRVWMMQGSEPSWCNCVTKLQKNLLKL